MDAAGTQLAPICVATTNSDHNKQANNHNSPSDSHVQSQNLQSTEDAKRVKFLQEENEMLQEKVALANEKLLRYERTYAMCSPVAEGAKDLKLETRKLQQEVDEKNEIISVLRDELEALKEQSDKFKRDNMQLIKDANRVKFLQDENDFLQEKVASIKNLELEIKRLKERLNEMDFLKIRINELEEDRTKAQEESQQFEDKWQQAEAKLTRVIELEAELSKWKSFSQELEQEKKSIESRLLETIEQESKLNSVNEKVEDEVKRLRNLVKNLEEQRDEEQASNSLIDLKTELNDENKNLRVRLEEQASKLEDLADSNKRLSDELECNKKTISDLRQDLACEKTLAQRLDNHVASLTKQLKNLDLQYFPRHSASQSQPKVERESTESCERARLSSDLSLDSDETTDFNQNIASRKEGILKDSNEESNQNSSDLSLSCSKASEQEPTCGAKPKKQAQPTKEHHQTVNRSTPITDKTVQNETGMEIEDKKYLPPTQSKGTDSSSAISMSGGANPIWRGDTDDASDKLRSSTKSRIQQQKQPGEEQVSPRDQSKPITTTPSHVTNYENTSAPNHIDFSGIKKGNATEAKLRSGSPPTSRTQYPSDPPERAQRDDTAAKSDSTKSDQVDGYDAGRLDTKGTVSGNRSDQAADKQTPLECNTATRATSNSSNFVRNSLPSRSVNFGHSRSSAYLDRIRASVTATTTTNTISSFNEHNMKDVSLTFAGPDQLQQHDQAQQQCGIGQPNHVLEAKFVLNCMLDHKHTDRCYAPAENVSPAHVQVSQKMQNDSYHNLHQHHIHQHQMNSPSVRPSRQLNALLDERLMTLQDGRMANGCVGLQQMTCDATTRQQHSHQPGGRLPNPFACESGGKLTEQERAYLNDIHYYFHLHQLQHICYQHDVHQHHMHMHHLHQKHRHQQSTTAPGSEQTNLNRHQGNTAKVNSTRQHETSATTTFEPSQTPRAPASSSDSMRAQREHIGASQFCAPGGDYDQIYATMAANNRLNLLNEQRQKDQLQKRIETGLVNNEPALNISINNNSPRQEFRVSPSKMSGNCRFSSQGGLTQYQLPQIDEMNGLPIVGTTPSKPSNKGYLHAATQDRQHTNIHQQIQKTKSPQRVNGLANSDKQQQAPSSLNDPSPPSSSSTSPTSSSNLSPSSATSSSSSLNSLSTSSAPLNRSTLRHTATALSRRQFSVERELVNSAPLTATLSRVGSCRGTVAPRNPCENQMLNSRPPLLRHPAKTLQPSMKTSKILNIGHTSPNTSARVPDNLSKNKTDDKSPYSHVKTNKKSSRSIDSASFVNHNQSIKSNGHPICTTNTPSKSSTNGDHRSSNSTPSSKDTKNDTNTKVNSKSPNIWFEYGCV